ncbi:hypothetical protein SJAV_01210 [Sulfurisphaera javensis]|uniref:Uncharacterized protein n=1 Tax=Sulfurisphaera javensis TaxID=2049879 RepID=A0AAT9GMQ7_9CREN
MYSYSYTKYYIYTIISDKDGGLILCYKRDKKTFFLTSKDFLPISFNLTYLNGNFYGLPIAYKLKLANVKLGVGF